MRDMQTATTQSYFVRIHMAGDIAQAKQVCREQCYAVGLCVTVTPQTFIYTGGEEEGFVVGLLNYPRFPSTPDELREKARTLADRLRERLFQHSYLLETSDVTTWVTARDENKAAK